MSKSSFYDLIEVIEHGHPVGRYNIISTDFAVLNCFANCVLFIMIFLAAQQIWDIGHPAIYGSIALILYML